MLSKVTQRKLTGQRLQVITKACNYVLQPGESYQGTLVWFSVCISASASVSVSVVTKVCSYVLLK